MPKNNEVDSASLLESSPLESNNDSSQNLLQENYSLIAISIPQML